MGTRVEDEEEVLDTRVALDGQLARTPEGLRCKEGEMPTTEQNQYCHYLKGAEEACRSDVKCRWVDLSVEQNGKDMCKPECQTSSNSGVNGLAVPPEVVTAVEEARRVAEEAKSNAAEKVQETEAAAEDARTKKRQAEKRVEDAAAALELAESKEREAVAAKEQMEGALEQAASKDTATSSAVDAWKAATVVKQQKLEVMNAALKAKQDKEAEWKDQDGILKTRMDKLNSNIAELQKHLDSAKALRQDLQGQRSAIKMIKKTEGKEVVAAWNKVFAEYKAQKDNTEILEQAAKERATASSEASAQATAAFEAYWEKVNLWNEASAEKASRKAGSDTAQEVALEAQISYAQQAEVQAAALQEEADALALKMKVEQVYEFAAVFYENLKKVKDPQGGNAMMNVVMLVQDPAMKPTLASYNVVATAANELAESSAEIIAPLKEGILKIDSARSAHFEQWCKGENFARMIWGANEIQKVELQLQ